MQKTNCERCGRDFWIGTKPGKIDPICPRCGHNVAGEKVSASGPRRRFVGIDAPDRPADAAARERPMQRLRLDRYPTLGFDEARDRIGGFLQEMEVGFQGFKDVPALNPELKMAQVNLDVGEIVIEVVLGQATTDAGPRTDLMLSAMVCPTPPKRTTAFFRRLLEWNNFATDVAHFALNPGHDSVYLVCRRPAWTLARDEFEYLIEAVAKVALNSRARLLDEFEFDLDQA